VTPELRHWLFVQEADTEQKAREAGYTDIAQSCRETQISLIRKEVLK